MSESNLPNFVPAWKQKMNNYVNTLNELNEKVIQLPLWLRRAGWLLLLIGVIVLMSGCNQTVIREECAPYPPLPTSLDQPPKNYDLIPSKLLPLSNVKKD